MHDMH